MPHDNTATDSELLASWTVDAIGLGRLQLAEALLRLANQARKVEGATLVRMAGQTRDESPVRPYIVRDVPDGPTGNGDADLARAEVAATAIFGAVQEKQLGVPESSRCVAFVVDSGFESACNMPIYWNHGHVGDQNQPMVSAGWFHVDPAADQHHQAVRGE
jgi:hypothetical protein